MAAPAVAAIIPAHQAARTVGATLASVCAQTYPSLQIIVVDDGSRDGTGEIVARAARADSRIRVLRQDNAGVATARNAAIAAAEGARWIAPLDADDLWHPEKIARQVTVAESARPSPGMVYCWSRRIDENGRILGDLGQPRHHGDVLAQLVSTNFVGNASVPMMRRDAVLAAGGYDAGLQRAGVQGAEDLKLCLALAARERVEVVPAFLTGYRQASGSMSQAPERMRRSVELVLADFERMHADVPADLMRIARTNYDIYAATLARDMGKTGEFWKFVAKALYRAPAHSGVILAFKTARALADAIGGARVHFDDLDPAVTVLRPLAKLFEDYQTHVVTKAAARSGARGIRSAEDTR